MSAWCQDEVLPKDSRAAFILVQPRIPGFLFHSFIQFLGVTLGRPWLCRIAGCPSSGILCGALWLLNACKPYCRPGFQPVWPRYRRVHAFTGGSVLPRACRLRVDCTCLRGVLRCGYGVWHAIQGPWLVGAVPRHNLSEHFNDRRVIWSRPGGDPFSGGGTT